MSTNNQRIYDLLEEEELARQGLLMNIMAILECKVVKETFVEIVEQVLLATKDYIAGVKELTDLLKETPINTKPQHINFDKAPNTERSAK